jgi:hypothetical protein
MPRTYRAAPLSFVLIAILVTTGCLSEPLQPSLAPPPAQASVNRAPRDVLAEIKRVVSAPPLNLGVSEELDGVIVTGWQRHPGNIHIARRWQERTRYRIAVIPDWNEPTQRARIEIAPQTEERAAEGQTWTAAPQIHRPERAQAVLDQLTGALNAPSGATPATR